MAFIIIILLIILNGYFSMAEIALVSVKDADFENGQGRQNPQALQVLKLIRDPEGFLSAVQVGITLLGLLEGIYGGNMVAVEMESWFMKIGMSNLVAHISSLVIGIGVITYLTIVFGELVPKSIALQMPVKVSLAIAPSLRLFSRILYPFIKMLTESTRIILSALSIKAPNNNKITGKDLKNILSTAYKQGLLGQQQLWMSENVFTFNKLKAKSIMKPARIIICLSSDWSREQVIQSIRQRPYSYFPVYKDEPGNIIGVIKTKDFFLHETANWQQNIKANCSIPEEMTAKDIFNVFQEKKLDFGIVTDGAGRFLGVVAMQDIMEGIFGDMPELEDYSTYFYRQSEKRWIAESFIHLQRIRNTLSLPWLRDYEGRYLSISELYTGEINHRNSDGRLVLNGVSFQVLSGSIADPQTIEITLPPIPT